MINCSSLAGPVEITVSAAPAIENNRCAAFVPAAENRSPVAGSRPSCSARRRMDTVNERSSGSLLTRDRLRGATVTRVLWIQRAMRTMGMAHVLLQLYKQVPDRQTSICEPWKLRLSRANLTAGLRLSSSGHHCTGEDSGSARPRVPQYASTSVTRSRPRRRRCRCQTKRGAYRSPARVRRAGADADRDRRLRDRAQRVPVRHRGRGRVRTRSRRPRRSSCASWSRIGVPASRISMRCWAARSSRPPEWASGCRRAPADGRPVDRYHARGYRGRPVEIAAPGAPGWSAAVAPTTSRPRRRGGPTWLIDEVQQQNHELLRRACMTLQQKRQEARTRSIASSKTPTAASLRSTPNWTRTPITCAAPTR